MAAPPQDAGARRSVDDIWRSLNAGSRKEGFDKLWSGLRSGEGCPRGAAKAAGDATTLSRRAPGPPGVAPECQNPGAGGGAAARLDRGPLDAAALERAAAQLLDPSVATRRAALEHIQVSVSGQRQRLLLCWGCAGLGCLLLGTMQ